MMRTRAFSALNLVAVAPIGKFRCPGCMDPAIVELTEPADPLRPTSAPRCERCGAHMAPVNEPRGSQ